MRAVSGVEVSVGLGVAVDLGVDEGMRVSKTEVDVGAGPPQEQVMIIDTKMVI
jgi:hypothetical protein